MFGALFGLESAQCRSCASAADCEIGVAVQWGDAAVANRDFCAAAVCGAGKACTGQAAVKASFPPARHPPL